MAPEYLRVTACQILMDIKNNEREAFQILFDLLQQSNDASTIIPLLQEKEFLKLHHNKIVPLLLNYAKNTNVEEIKFNILNIFFKNQDIKNMYCNELVDYILDLAQNTNCKNIKRRACQTLWNERKAIATRYNEIILSLLDFAINAKNEDIATEIFNRLFVEIRREETCQDELILPFLERAKNEINVKDKYSYLSALWSNQKIRTLHYNELVLQFVDLIQKPTCTNIQDILSLLEDDPLILIQHESIFRNVYRKLITEFPEIDDLKVNAYLLFGSPFQEYYNQFIINTWQTSRLNIKRIYCQRISNRYGSGNPRIQELLLLLAYENNNHCNPVSIYADLHKKIKNPYAHHPSIFALKLEEENEQILRFSINPSIFDYLPASQDPLANLDDVDFILGDDIDATLKTIRDDANFKKYFAEPFSEESMMLQAMVQKFKKMGVNGKNKLVCLLIDMMYCPQGKNKAIWDNYATESQALCLADLKNINNWLQRLQTSDIDLSNFKKSKNQLATIILDMLKPDHIFHRHLTDLKTEEAQLLKALLGSIVEFERSANPNDHIALEKTLKSALNILVKLSNPKKFHEKLDQLCEAHEIYLPANKFGEQLSPASIEDLIQKLKESDVKGRGEILALQEKMRIFVNNEDFLALLHNFENESGNKLRELLNGYISNGWPVGLLNLMALTHEEKLENAIDAIFKHTSIDKDIALTWMNLKKVLIKELINIKRQRINAIAEELTGQKHNEIPHTIGYIEDLLGGAIGLRNTQKSPNFDVYMRESFITSKSLQEMLNIFHKDFTAEHIINHINEMLIGNRLSIIEPETGMNIIWNMVSLAAKEQLRAKGIDENLVDLDMLFYNENGKEAIKLAMALLLTKLGILDEIDEHSNPFGNNNNIIN